MFKEGVFSSDPTNPCQVDTEGLRRLDAATLARGLQVSDANPLAGLEGRAGLMARLAIAMSNTKYFGAKGRPGHMLGMLTLDLHRARS